MKSNLELATEAGFLPNLIYDAEGRFERYNALIKQEVAKAIVRERARCISELYDDNGNARTPHEIIRAINNIPLINALRGETSNG